MRWGSVHARSTAHGVRRRRVVLIDAGWALLLAAVLLPATVQTIWGSSWPPSLQAVVLGAVLTGHAAVVLRRRAPRLAFAVVGAVVLLLVLAPAIEPAAPPYVGEFSAVLVPSLLVFPVVLYSVAAWCPHRTSLLALCLSSIGALVVLVRLWDADYLTVAQPGLTPPGEPVRSWPLFLVLGVGTIVALPWLSGRYRRLRMLYVAELERRAHHEESERAAQACQAVFDERRRIAREMHDVVAHSLSVLVTQAEGGRLLARKEPEAASRALSTIARTGREAMQSMAFVLKVLDAPGDVHDRVQSPQPGLAQLPGLIEEVRRAGLPVHVEERGQPQRLGEASALVAYRVVQEALTNVLKHAGPQAATELTLTWRPASLALSVTSSKSCEPSAPGSGLGLASMAERLSAIGGSLHVADEAERFRIEACIPVVEGAIA